jgi:alpha-tubulin suppressor-like RCC1 family protein
MALKTDNGSCWSWGDGQHGMLGDNTVTAKSSPVSVAGSHSFIKIAASAFNGYGLKADNGTVWSWGLGTSGQLGDNQIAANRSSPVSVVGAHSFIELSADSTHVAVIKADGSCWGWGSGGSGQLGDGTLTSWRSSPVSVVGAHSFIKVAAGGLHTLALKADGTIWGWGLNTSGQLADNTLTLRTSPVMFIGGGFSFTAINSLNNRCMALRSDGAIFVWGDVGTELGDRSVPTSMARLIY